MRFRTCPSIVSTFLFSHPSQHRLWHARRHASFSHFCAWNWTTNVVCGVVQVRFVILHQPLLWWWLSTSQKEGGSSPGIRDVCGSGAKGTQWNDPRWRIFCLQVHTDDGRVRCSSEVEREGGERSDPMQRNDGRKYKDTRMVLYPTIPCKVQDKTRGPHATRWPDSIDPPAHAGPRKGISQIRSLCSALSCTIRYSRDATLKHCMLKHTPGCSKVKTHAR